MGILVCVSTVHSSVNRTFFAHFFQLLLLLQTSFLSLHWIVSYFFCILYQLLGRNIFMIVFTTIFTSNFNFKIKIAYQMLLQVCSTSSCGSDDEMLTWEVCITAQCFKGLSKKKRIISFGLGNVFEDLINMFGLILKIHNRWTPAAKEPIFWSFWHTSTWESL